MDSERLPKRVMFGEVEGGGRVTRETKSRTGWGVSHTVYRCSTCPPNEVEHWMDAMAAKKPGSKWVRCVEEAA